MGQAIYVTRKQMNEESLESALAALLPPEYRGVYAKRGEYSDELEPAAEGSKREVARLSTVPDG
jgi:hypothetical protein